MIPYDDLVRRSLSRQVRRFGKRTADMSHEAWAELASVIQLRQGELDATSISGELNRWLDDPDPFARFEAVEWLEALATCWPLEMLPDVDETLSPGDVIEPANRALIRATGDPADFVRARAARALGEIGPEAAAAKTVLEALLGDLDADVRQAAAEALRALP